MMGALECLHLKGKLYFPQNEGEIGIWGDLGI